MDKPSRQLVKALAVTAELTQTDFSDAAARVLADDLAEYPEDQVLGALLRCRRELKGRLSVAEIVSRLADGRPGPEEAWAMAPRTESASAVWTEEMRQAFFVAYPLINEGDTVQARMAFLEAYRNLVTAARALKLVPQWSFSPGTDKAGREAVIVDAVAKGRLSSENAHLLLPHHREDPELRARLLEARALKFLPAA